MKFTLICEHDEGYKVTHEFDNILLADTLDKIQNFLKGCGFVFDGVLDIIDENEAFQEQPYPYVVEEPTPSDLSKEYRNSDVDLDGRC